MSDIEILEVSAGEILRTVYDISDGVYYQHEQHGFDVTNEELRYFVFDDPETTNVDMVFAVRVEATIQEFVKDVKWWVLQGTHWPHDGLPAGVAVLAYGDWTCSRYFNIHGLSGVEPETFAVDLSSLFEQLALVLKELNCTGVA